MRLVRDLIAGRDAQVSDDGNEVYWSVNGVITLMSGEEAALAVALMEHRRINQALKRELMTYAEVLERFKVYARTMGATVCADGHPQHHTIPCHHCGAEAGEKCPAEAGEDEGGQSEPGGKIYRAYAAYYGGPGELLSPEEGEGYNAAAYRALEARGRTGCTDTWVNEYEAPEG